MLLHAGFGRRCRRVQVDIRRACPCSDVRIFCGRTHAGHPIPLFVHASGKQGARMNICTKPSRRPKPDACRTAWYSTMFPSMPAG
jgi:hypothetical protein